MRKRGFSSGEFGGLARGISDLEKKIPVLMGLGSWLMIWKFQREKVANAKCRVLKGSSRLIQNRGGAIG
jgi:hypothetical protein